MRLEKMEKNGGFTILELMITVSLLAIVLALAVPSFRATLQNNRLTAQANDLATGMQLARSEALKRNRPVSVCASSDNSTCEDEWADGWIVFLDDAALGSDTPSVAEILRAWGPLSGESTLNDVGDVEFVRFLPNGSVDDRDLDFPWVFELRIPGCTTDSARDISVQRLGRVAAQRADCE